MIVWYANKKSNQIWCSSVVPRKSISESHFLFFVDSVPSSGDAREIIIYFFINTVGLGDIKTREFSVRYGDPISPFSPAWAQWVSTQNLACNETRQVWGTFKTVLWYDDDI